jgi:hypothetical protein
VRAQLTSSRRNRGIGNFQGENPEAYESRPSLRMRGNNLNLRRKSRKKSHIGKSTFVRSGESKAKALRPLKSRNP